ncbi:Acyl-CoA dehydrogenase/oxidase [Penicillium expansum]|uniref:Acyl-CoA dehydrogenase/oxidase n=1 Tax=Penicillium expansum TaxID=27334 RepID=A0A0A2KEU5_PENEN|nr:Acyl-CoA dehydrogenase/oxidase [Penicillium expansum]KGO62870.1 Acyl-CoA dehydrogenase/oxidase [Penicillium expansum]
MENGLQQQLQQLQNLQQLNPAMEELARSELFKPAPRSFSLEESTKLSYQRAKAFANAYGLTLKDVLYITPKFWKLHREPLLTLDGGAFTLLSIQCNLFVGTLAPFALKRPELQPILQSALDFDISAQFMLTEVNHGLDARNIQTTATILPDGDIDLHTPSPNDAKVMPPTTPRGGIPVVAIVMARLVSEDKDCGIRPFLVQLGNGKEMCKGVISKALPQRTGAHPVDHALTYFDHVRLPRSALLGSSEETENKREEFLSSIHRVAVGTLFLSGCVIPSLKLAAFNAACFSQNRLVSGQDGSPMAVIDFRTQHMPILHTIAQYSVLEAFFVSAAMAFREQSVDPRVRHGIATAFKAISLGHFNKSIIAMNERCGWHGHYEHNQLLQIELEMRGASTAEGDIRVLAIRLASELLIGRYQMPPPNDPSSPIARHEASLFSEARDLLQQGSKGAHRSEQFNRNILPLALPLVEAIGHRMAYEAAIDANIDSSLLNLYESGVMKQDSAWYVEQGGLSRGVQREMEAQAVDVLLPQMKDLLLASGVQPYSNAPMTSKTLWNDFVSGLEVFSGDAPSDLFP